jgi:hypothetical protein
MDVPRSITATNLASLASIGLSGVVAPHPLKYLSTTQFIEHVTSSFNEETPEISTLDHYLYHGGLLLLFKGVLGPTSLNNEYLLSILSLPSIQKAIIDSPKFQDYKRALGLKIVIAILTQDKTSLAKKLAFKAAMHYMNQTPLRLLIQDFDETTPPTIILDRIKESAAMLSRNKLSSATILTQETAHELGQILEGRLNTNELADLANELGHFINDFSLTGEEEISLFSSQILSSMIGKSSLYSLNPCLAICSNLSKHATISEAVIRIAGCVFSLSSSNPLLSIIVTEIAASILARPISRHLNDSGEVTSYCKNQIKSVERNVASDLKETYGLREKQIRCLRRFFLDTSISALTLASGYSLHPALHSLTNLHIIQTVLPRSRSETPDFFDAMFVQGASAITLTALNALIFTGPLGKCFLNTIAININNPFLMREILKNPQINALTRAARRQIPGLSPFDDFSYIEPLVDAGATTVSRYSPTLGRVMPIAIRSLKGTAVLRQITDHLGGVDATIGHCRIASSHALNAYGNYVLLTTASMVLSPEVGVAAAGAGVGRNYSKCSVFLGISLGSATFYLTQSPAITSVVITAVHALSERFFGMRA